MDELSEFKHSLKRRKNVFHLSEISAKSENFGPLPFSACVFSCRAQTQGNKLTRSVLLADNNYTTQHAGLVNVCNLFYSLNSFLSFCSCFFRKLQHTVNYRVLVFQLTVIILFVQIKLITFYILIGSSCGITWRTAVKLITALAFLLFTYRWIRTNTCTCIVKVMQA